MNTYWSTYVQTTEELYLSRSLRFREENIDELLRLMRLRDGMRILEVGCAGGLLCHLIKKRLPGCEVFGVDLDDGHIAYARNKSRELGLDCAFTAADAAALPFGDGFFDVCFSHTVINFCEPQGFISEQKRVLKPGGRLIVMDVYRRGALPEQWVPTEECEEFALFDRLWESASGQPSSRIKRYEDRQEAYFALLAGQGFTDISADAFASVTYAPDCDNFSGDAAISQINEDRVSELASVSKAHALAPDGLTAEEYAELLALINERYDKRVREYLNGKKTWEFRISTTLIISGAKSECSYPIQTRENEDAPAD